MVAGTARVAETDLTRQHASLQPIMWCSLPRLETRSAGKGQTWPVPGLSHLSFSPGRK